MLKRLLTLTVLLFVAGCSLDQQTIPSPSGPSELGLSINITATPEVLSQDGVSQSRIEVVARDASSKPVSGLSIRVDTYVGGVAKAVGSLSAGTIVTGSDGHARVDFQAPASGTFTKETLVTIALTPSNSISRTVSIRIIP